MNHEARIKAFLENIVAVLTGGGGEIRLVDGRRATCFEIHVPPEQRGQLIGKEGMTIRALRVLAGISAHRHRRRFEIEVPGQTGN